MPTNQTTTGRGYPLPYPSNLLAEDVQRLRDALQAIDSDITARPTSTTVQGLVDAAVAALVAGAPGALNTLDELAAALGDDANFAATVANSLATLNSGLTNRYTKAESDARFVQGAVYYNRRPALHRGSLFYKTAAATISVVAGAVLNGKLYSVATAVTMPSHSNNTDYAIWQHPSTGALVADASFTTAPAGATGGSIVGGYHYIPSGRPTAINSGSATGAAEILEFSLWDLTWRPSCPDPRGMACVEGGFWIDLYLCGATSYAGSTFSAVPSSRIGLTIADGNSPPLVPAQFGGNGSTTYGSFTWYEASEMAASFGKRLPSYGEFSAAAFGAPEASSHGSDPGTVQWERVSKFGLAQATGTMWQWGSDYALAGNPVAWTSNPTEGRGDVYDSGFSRAVILGGSWYISSYSGSRAARWGDTPSASNDTRGARFVAGHLVLG